MRKNSFLAGAALLAAALAVPELSALPLITSVVETGGVNEATDTVAAKYTGQTFSNGVAGEFQNPFLVPVFGEDVPAYVDRTHQWNGATAELPLPEYLVGGEYIMVGNDNRDRVDLRLAVTVSAPAQVYLLIDNRLQDASAGDPPTFDPNMLWVTEQGWQPVLNGLNRTADSTIPDEIGIDEGGNGTGPGGDIQNYNSIYAKQFPSGTFELAQADNAGQNMYGVVVTRVSGAPENPPKITDLAPTNNTLYFNPSGGLHFGVTTVSPNNIALSNISLLLDGTNVSGQLTIGGTGTARTAAYSNLTANMLYSGMIIVSDQAGRSVTNNFMFDTFTESSGLVIEAEDYNFSGGQFKDSIPVGAFDTLAGLPEVDVHTANEITPAAVYRTGDLVGIGASGDVARAKFSAGGTDYTVNNIYAGDWINYTRVFPSNSFRLFLRASAAAPQQVRLDRVTGDTSGTNQNTFPLGTFTLAGGSYSYASLNDANGRPVTVGLSGTNTLRLTSSGGNANLQYNYLLLVPASAPS
ncbi:MAG TPA: hypothetical protein VK633_04045, partial [Verrucomicrobiae bacterium]|nr:hypothetical protein [Verrucomicrobiae bacterium]